MTHLLTWAQLLICVVGQLSASQADHPLCQQHPTDNYYPQLCAEDSPLFLFGWRHYCYYFTLYQAWALDIQEVIWRT